MSYYRLYFLKNDHFMRFEEFFAETDRAAADRSTRLAGAQAAELWRGGVKIRRFPAPDAARSAAPTLAESLHA